MTAPTAATAPAPTESAVVASRTARMLRLPPSSTSSSDVNVPGPTAHAGSTGDLLAGCIHHLRGRPHAAPPFRHTWSVIRRRVVAPGLPLGRIPGAGQEPHVRVVDRRR